MDFQEIVDDVDVKMDTVFKINVCLVVIACPLDSSMKKVKRGQAVNKTGHVLIRIL
jgi:hypothetical protein